MRLRRSNLAGKRGTPWLSSARDGMSSALISGSPERWSEHDASSRRGEAALVIGVHFGRDQGTSASTARWPWRTRCAPGTILGMSSRARQIIEEALALPKDELVRVVAELQEQVEATDSDSDVEAAWRDEIVRRMRSIQDGSAVLHDGDEVDAELAKILEER